MRNMQWNKIILYIVLLVAVIGVHIETVRATSYLTVISDTISQSAPATNANHTIRFTTNQAIPANGVVEIYFNEGGVTIPATLNYTDVDMAFSATVGGPYTERPLSSVQSPGTDDVTVTTGANGMIRFDLNTSIGIPAGNEVVIEIGTNATYGSIGDVQMVNDTATGTYPVTIYTYDVSDVELDYGRTMISIHEQVTVYPVDTTDQIPPVILSAEPTGILQTGVTAVELYLTTDELSSCRFATSSMAYASMPYSFYGTSSGLVRSHFTLVTGLEDDSTYLYYIRCVDYRLNEIDPDYELTFDIGVPPGSATTTSTSTGGTEGGGIASTTATSGPGTGDDIGTGDGPTGTGDGDGPIGGDGGGSGSGGSGSSASGDKLPQADVAISGWAYPGATVTFLRDGTIVDTEGSGSGGAFEHTTEGLDRGSYTFGIYATDSRGVRSATFSTTLWLRAETLNTISNVMLPPTLTVPNNSVNPGETLAVSGYSTPGSTVTTFLRPKLAEVSTADVVSTTSVSTNGSWSLSIPTTGLTTGTYELIAQAEMDGGEVESDKSIRKTIGIGVDVSEADGDCISIGDLNCDGYVNLVDFSILLFNWNTSNAVADINRDGFVSLPDFSVMLFNWTG
jgi:hypothetical protein